jgi:hypothetical protein
MPAAAVLTADLGLIAGPGDELAAGALLVIIGAAVGWH